MPVLHREVAKTGSEHHTDIFLQLYCEQWSRLSVTAHHLDTSLHPHAILLGSRDIRGSPSGESIAKEPLRVVRDFKFYILAGLGVNESDDVPAHPIADANWLRVR